MFQLRGPICFDRPDNSDERSKALLNDPYGEPKNGKLAYGVLIDKNMKTMVCYNYQETKTLNAVNTVKILTSYVFCRIGNPN